MTLTPRLVQPLGEWPPWEPRADKNAYDRQWRLRAKQDPVKLAKLKEARRKQWERVKADPARLARNHELKKASYARRHLKKDAI